MRKFAYLPFALVLALGVVMATVTPAFALATGNIADVDLTAQVIGMSKTGCVQKVIITNTGGAGVLDIDSFAVDNTAGSAGDADVTRVAIWKDTNANGTWEDPGDTEIDWAANFSGAGALGGNNEAACLSVVKDTTEVVFVVVTTAPPPPPPPTDGFTFKTRINGDDLVAGSTDTWAAPPAQDTATSATTIDAVNPTATTTTTVNPIYEGALTQIVIVTYNESMNPATTPLITLTGANWGLQAAGAWSQTGPPNDTYTTTLTHTGLQEEIGAAVATVASGSGATDVAGNTDVGDISAPPFIVDTQKPTVVIASVAPDPTNTSPIPVTATFSENVTLFVVGNITVGNGAAGNFVPVSGTVYTFDVTPAGQGLVTVDIGAGVAQDVATNTNTAAAQFTITYVAPYGGGGGGGATASGVGSINLSNYLDSQGKAISNITLTSTDGLVSMGILWGTLALDAQGNPLGNLQIVTLLTPLPPSGYVLVGHAYDCLPAGATFQPAMTLTLKYHFADIPDGVSEEDLVLAYWDGGKWVNLPTTVNVITNAATAKAAHFTPFAILAYTGAPAFDTSDLTITPTEVDIGKEVTIRILVANTGDLGGSYEVTLKIDNVAVATKVVTLAASDSERVTFATAKDAAGNYKVSVDGLSGSFVVKEAASPSPPPTSPPPTTAPPPAGVINWWLVIGVIAGCIIVGVLIAVAVRRR